ncbi:MULTISPECIES: chromate transporter [unclassified Mycoplasma]|uniref:chromate transporter n=1 Tax=unclassified Mycoplasma TaxID=2683645 RepID=UPI000FDEF258
MIKLAMLREAARIAYFIFKITLLGFGGGNAMNPIIFREAVQKRKWITKVEFDRLVITTNALPGPSAVEFLVFIAMKRLGKWIGTLVTLLAMLPHVLLALVVYILINNYVEARYMYAVNLAVMPVIVGVLLSFAWRYFKASRKELRIVPLVLTMLGTVLFGLFVPNPYNVSIFAILAVIGVVSIVQLFVRKKSAKRRGKR